MDDLYKAVQAEKIQHREDLRNNQFWVSMLVEQDRFQTGYDQLLKYDSILDTITPEDLEAAARQYFNHKNYASFVMNPVKNSQIHQEKK